VSLIPVTLSATVAGAWRVATKVNLEVDLIARYVARTLDARDRATIFATASAEG
jgi:riboflavin synthase